MPKPLKPKTIEILSGSLTRKRVRVAWMQGEAKFDLDENENPLPDLPKRLEAIGDLVVEILHLPKDWKEDLRVVGLELGTLGGSPTASVIFSKSLDDTTREFRGRTPPKLLAHPTEPGEYHPALSEKKASLIWAAVEAFKDYVKGERAQGKLGIDDDGGESGETKGKEELLPLKE